MPHAKVAKVAKGLEFQTNKEAYRMVDQEARTGIVFWISFFATFATFA